MCIQGYRFPTPSYSHPPTHPPTHPPNQPPNHPTTRPSKPYLFTVVLLWSGWAHSKYFCTCGVRSPQAAGGWLVGWLCYYAAVNLEGRMQRDLPCLALGRNKCSQTAPVIMAGLLEGGTSRTSKAGFLQEMPSGSKAKEGNRV